MIGRVGVFRTLNKERTLLRCSLSNKEIVRFVRGAAHCARSWTVKRPAGRRSAGRKYFEQVPFQGELVLPLTLGSNSLLAEPAVSSVLASFIVSASGLYSKAFGPPRLFCTCIIR